tara:strand:+ start:368 stop:664 length:297 start_codon:yes stop_codon:yes gene_type:complete
MPQGKGTYGTKRGRPKTKTDKAKTSTVELGGKKIPIKKDALRNQLKVPEGKKIPMSFLNKIIKAKTGDMVMNPFTKKEIKVTDLLTKRASLGRTLKKM